MEPVLKYYTVADLKQWLLHNKPADGLSERIIAPTRAYAIMNNPYVKDEDAVVSAIFEDGEPAAFTAAFPEILERPKGKLAWWFSTLYCRPESVGKGYGLIVVGQLSEMIGNGNFFDINGADETVEIFKYLNLTTVRFPEYSFSIRHIKFDALWSIASYVRDKLEFYIINIRKHSLKRKFNNIANIRYHNFINDSLYDFILTNSENDVFLRTKSTFNWIISFPFLQYSPLIKSEKNYNYFTSDVREYRYLVVEVLFEKNCIENTIGVYIMRIKNRDLSIKYIYYQDDYDVLVFDSVLEHILFFNPESFSTNDFRLAKKIELLKLFPKKHVVNRSFSFPEDFKYEKLIQAGDGDMFV